jgi:DNA repair exonuclease SbcCD ATPase subunit
MVAEKELVEGQIKEIGDINYSEDDYNKMKKENDLLISKMAEARTTISHLKEMNVSLQKSEYCPVCHRKFDDVDNTETINKNVEKIQQETKHGIEMKKRSEELTASMNAISENRVLFQKKSKLELRLAAINSEIISQRADYTEKKALLNDIKKNEESIKKNNEIDTKLNVINENIRANDEIRRSKEQDNIDIDRHIAKNNEAISTNKSYILKIEEEQKTEKNWKLYLQMIGKDGISKMVLRNTLPIINSELNRLLDDTADFSVEVTMDDKNDIDFLLIRDGVVTRLAGASGLETTQAALALRVVLGKMSRLSRPPFILLDEILGTVAKENLDDMKKLYDKIVSEYDFVLHICHIDLDWYSEGNVITVTKKDNISSISN